MGLQTEDKQLGDPAGGSLDAARFYDRYVEEHVPFKLSPRGLKRLILSFLPYWSYLEWRFWDLHLPTGSKVLDLGSARGREVFCEGGRRTIGVDLAQAALRECADSYQGATLATLAALPFPSASFDCVVSSHVMGHIPAASKSAVISEMHRVLRPGGQALHIIECDSKHPFVELAKQRPELFQRNFIQPDGHVGLETASRTIERFERSGFRAEHVEPSDSGPWHPRHVLKWFDNAYRGEFEEVDKAVGRAAAIIKSPLRLAAEEVRLGLLHRLNRRRYPLDHAQFLSLVVVKS